jgi:DNA-binding beta-propeller fold protein YncE
VLSENTLLASDLKKNTGSFVIFSLEKSNAKCIKETKFKNQPCGMTKVSDNKVTVTFPDEGMIRLITFSEEMEVLHITEIPGHGRFYGIAYSNNHLVVLYYKYFTGSIKILSMSGEIVKSFEKDDNSQDLLMNSYYLAVSPDNSLIYVSDWSSNTVTCLTFDGKVKAIFKDDQLKRPQKLAVDEYGSVYVCGHDSNNVHQLSHDLTKVKILIDNRHGIIRPTSIAYCQNTKRLFVGMNQNTKIKDFNVTLK